MAQQPRKPANTGKLTPAQFTVTAIKALRKNDKDGNPRLGLHTVYSGFMLAFREYFGYEVGNKVQKRGKDGQMKWVTEKGTDEAINMLEQLAKDGVIEMHGARGGSMIYLPGDMPEFENHDADKTIATILAHSRK